MKKLLMTIAAFTLAVGIASAATIQEQCPGPSGGINTNPVFAATPVSCPQITAAQLAAIATLGDSLTSITITAFDSFQQSTPGITTTFTFTYTNIDPDLGTGAGVAPNSCQLPGPMAGNQCMDAVSGNISGNSGVYQIGQVISGVSFVNYEGSGTFFLADVQGTVTGGSFTSNGASGENAFVTYTYTQNVTPPGTPEPMSMMLVGGGLLGLGLAASKLRKKA